MILDALAANGNKREVARQLGINERSIYRCLNRHPDFNPETHGEEKSVDLPTFPDDDIPTEEIIASMERRFSKRSAHSQAKRWFPIKVNIDGPFGIMWYGDPHLDSNGCNWTDRKSVV